MIESTPSSPASSPAEDSPATAERSGKKNAGAQRSKRTSQFLRRRTARQQRQELKQQTPGWATSLLLHAAVLLTLALVTLPLPLKPELSLQASRIVAEQFELAEDLLDINVDFEPNTLDETLETPLEAEPAVELPAEVYETTESNPLEAVTAVVDLGVSASDISEILADSGIAASALSGRSQESKNSLLRSGGGTRSSEKAVQAALDWLARHQYPDGSWNFDHTHSECKGQCGDPGTRYSEARAAATGLALLTYLGAGHTQADGRYKRIVTRGILALGNMIKVDKNGGSFWDPAGRMYSHGIATMALCEAYAMTGDPLLREPAQAAINYVCYAQDPKGGGWRYRPRQTGDTSVVGWQIAALKSGYLSNLNVPTTVVQRASGFLDHVMTDDGARYYYQLDYPEGHHACTAIGALCRMYMGSKQNQHSLQAAIESLSNRGPSNSDVYYNYYTAQALFHHTGGKGSTWKKWNEEMRDLLVETQSKAGHEAGSWTPQGNSHAKAAGRLFTTALNTMTLEVYYRVMPIYRQEAIDSQFADQNSK